MEGASPAQPSNAGMSFSARAKQAKAAALELQTRASAGAAAAGAAASKVAGSIITVEDGQGNVMFGQEAADKYIRIPAVNVSSTLCC